VGNRVGTPDAAINNNIVATLRGIPCLRTKPMRLMLPQKVVYAVAQSMAAQQDKKDNDRFILEGSDFQSPIICLTIR
jgi:hypothetical protein